MITTWKQFFAEESKRRDFQELMARVTRAYASGKCYPPMPDLFSAFRLTPLKKIQCVILGQDPYHGEGQAHGLAFSVRAPNYPPPSLVNILLELAASARCDVPETGDLTPWAKRGVFLLNTCLSVEDGKPASHKALGWEAFTDRVIQTIAAQDRPIAFCLWGKLAQEKEELIRTVSKTHLILKTTHPSPYSAHYGFLGCRHFSKVNTWLTARGGKAINWKLP